MLPEDEHLVELLEEHGLTDYWPAIANSIREAVALLPNAGVETGRCHFGGLPTVDLSFDWPYCEGRPLDLLAQIDCSALSEFSDIGCLPERGVLLFFYDVERQPWGLNLQDRGFEVIYQENPEKECNHPLERPLPHAPLLAKRVQTLPRERTHSGDQLFGLLTLDLCDELGEFIETFEQWESGVLETDRMFGHAVNIQGDMTDRMPINSEASFDEWELLLQLDSIDEHEWGDGGKLYFWITRDDLALRNFDRVWCRLQCY